MQDKAVREGLADKGAHERSASVPEPEAFFMVNPPSDHSPSGGDAAATLTRPREYSPTATRTFPAPPNPPTNPAEPLRAMR